jgi:preprotein translocase subunit SecG
MLILFGILVIIASVVLGLIVLVQNPKGGGLSSSFGGFGNQIMGVKQTTDVLEKGTWLFAAIVAILCIVSPAFIPKDGTGAGKNKDLMENVNSKMPAATTPANTAAPAIPDTNKPK